jgi:hypothetical protein
VRLGGSIRDSALSKYIVTGHLFLDHGIRYLPRLTIYMNSQDDRDNVLLTLYIKGRPIEAGLL